LVECGREDEAVTALAALDRKFLATNSDSRLGLHCKLELRRGDVAVAEGFWTKLSEKGTPVHLALRANILRRKQDILGLSDAERAELASITNQLTLMDDGLEFIEE
jgi:hypothetical protein